MLEIAEFLTILFFPILSPSVHLCLCFIQLHELTFRHFFLSFISTTHHRRRHHHGLATATPCFLSYLQRLASHINIKEGWTPFFKRKNTQTGKTNKKEGKWTVDVAQLVDLSLLTPEIRCSNLVVSNFSSFQLYRNNKNVEKEAGNGLIFKNKKGNNINTDL